jgi:hypothetical protein
MQIQQTAQPRSFAETLQLLRAWQGEAETKRQLALLRQARQPVSERRGGDRRKTDRRGA